MSATPTARRGTYLGFDFGLERIGVAVGEAAPPASFPLTTLTSVRHRPDWSAIGKLIETWNPCALVVGIPVHMDGREQALTRATRRFAHQLRQRHGLVVHEADERLSSRTAHEIHIAQRRAGKKRGRTAAKDEDKIAAGVILMNWLQKNTP